MRLAYVIDGLAHGGAERSLLDMTPYWIQAGIELHLFVLGGSDALRAEFENTGAHVERLSASGRRARVLELRNRLRRIRPDLVHTTLAEADLAGRVAARLAALPVTSSLVTHSYGPEHLDEGPAVKIRAFQSLDAATSRLTVGLHAVSHSVADVMSARLRYPRSRIAVIPRGRDLDRFELWSRQGQRSKRDVLGLPLEKPLLVTVASHEYRKGLDVLLGALVTLPDVHLCILGRDGNETAALHRLANELSVSGRVTWMQPRSDVETVLLASDAFVLPSRREGFPGALLEAMATALPIAATDIAPVREAIDQWSDAVHLSRVDDSASLARACQAALGHPPPATALRRRVESEYALAGIADQMRFFFNGAADA